MTTQYFPAIVERGTGIEKGFGVFFPDLPGCVSAGATVNEAILNAGKALAIHLRGMAEDGEAVPPQRDFADIERDPEVNEASRVLIRAELPGKSVRFNATMDEGLLSQVDTAATGMSRSGYLADADRRMLGV